MRVRKIAPYFLIGILGSLPFNIQATTFEMPPSGNDIVGEVIKVRAGNDSLLTIGNRYDIGMHEMLESNPQLGLDENSASKSLGRGTQVIVPAQYILPHYRKGIVINLPELRLYYFSPDGKYVHTYPVGLGRLDWRTPLTSTSVIKKEVDPTWHVPKTIKEYVLDNTGKLLPDKIPPGEENPLGHYAMYLGTSGYLIHGTNQPWSIGKYISSGCIRMHNEDVEELYSYVNVGTPVHIINYADKAGWSEGQLYLQSRIPVELDQANGTLNEGSIDDVLNTATKSRTAAVDWNKVQSILSERNGIPQPVGQRYTKSRTAFNEDIRDEEDDDIDARYSNF